MDSSSLQPSPLPPFVTPTGELTITANSDGYVAIGKPIRLAGLPDPARKTAEAFTRSTQFRPMDTAGPTPHGGASARTTDARPQQ